MFYINIIPKIQFFIKTDPHNLNKSLPTIPPDPKNFQARDLGLYIHIPFCRTICAYCAFPAFAHKTAQIPEYLIALQKEIEIKSRLFRHRKLRTIYFGGGTPSLLEAPQLEQLLTAVRNNFDCSECLSVEIECNPESLTTEKIYAYRRLGLTRISVGVQTLDNRILKRLARPHNADASLQALAAFSQSGFKNFGCDLIIGLPYQTFAGFRQDVEKILTCHSAHLSIYFLMPDAPKINSFIADCPGENEQIEMWLWADNKLSKAGYNHYEVSNYALPGFESKHNLRYWKRQDYLGVGLGAHSFYHGTVWENSAIFEEYLKSPGKPDYKLRLTGELLLNDFILLALRTSNGIPLAEFGHRFGEKKELILSRSAEEWIVSGHLINDDNRLRASTKGWLILDLITKKLCL